MVNQVSRWSRKHAFLPTWEGGGGGFPQPSCQRGRNLCQRCAILCRENPEKKFTFSLCLSLLLLFNKIFLVFGPQPYVNIHGQLVRPSSRDSDDFRRPESLRSSRDALTPEPETPSPQWQPRGNEPDNRGAPEINYVSYLV